MGFYNELCNGNMRMEWNIKSNGGSILCMKCSLERLEKGIGKTWNEMGFENHWTKPIQVLNEWVRWLGG